MAAILLVGGCGGSGAASSVDAADTETAAEPTRPTVEPVEPTAEPAEPTPTSEPEPAEPTPEPEPAEPTPEPATPTPEAADPDLPEWASGETVTVGSDTGPLELPVELAPFCESSRSFFIAARGLDFVDPTQFGAAQQLFSALAVLAPIAIETAPSPEFAVEPTAARDQLGVLIPALEEIGYDASRLAELPDADTVVDALTGFAETRGSLQSFLIQACGADAAVLDEQARGAAATAAEATGETIEPAEPAPPVEAVAGTPIENDSSTIALSVPVAWTEIEESRLDGQPQIAVSSDLDGFYGLATPGVLVLRGEGGLRDGGFIGRVLSYQAELEAIDCELTDELDYDDGTYRGQERIFDCGTEGLDVRLLGGTNDDESLYAMVLLVNPIAEPGVRQLIVETFLVS